MKLEIGIEQAMRMAKAEEGCSIGAGVAAYDTDPVRVAALMAGADEDRKAAIARHLMDSVESLHARLQGASVQARRS